MCRKLSHTLTLKSGRRFEFHAARRRAVVRVVRGRRELERVVDEGLERRGREGHLDDVADDLAPLERAARPRVQREDGADGAEDRRVDLKRFEWVSAAFRASGRRARADGSGRDV